jgi:hypothetical protein
MSAMRMLIGLLSIVIPLGFIAVAVTEPIIWPTGREFFVWLRLVLGVSGIVMMIGFIRYTFRSDAVPRDKRGLWVTVLLLGNIFALPFYWLWYVRRPPSSGQAHS